MTMRSHPRHGSILLLCLAIVTALMMVAYAFVRASSLQHQTTQSETRQLLAREAAKMGLRHAMEDILNDHVHGPLSRMEGPTHAFIALNRPYETDYRTERSIPGGSMAVNIDDVPAENDILVSMGGGPYGWSSLSGQQHLNDGRGRFYEPEYCNRPVLGFDPAATEIVTPIRFGSASSLADPLPTRNRGNFYDASLRQIAGDPREARDAARYRLRYAVNIIDLEGQLVINGDPALDHRSVGFHSPLAYDSDPSHALSPAERVVRWHHAVSQLAIAMGHFDAVGHGWATQWYGGDRAAHVFLGRGCTANFDIDPATRSPITFPYMYRNTSINDFDAATDFFQSDPAGGVAIPSGGGSLHALTGPQFSFGNYDEAIEGTGMNGGNTRSYGRFTPFGRGMVTPSPKRFDRWQGNVDVPWNVNVMTAPAGVIYSMIAGWMPPGAVMNWYHERPPTVAPVIPNGRWIGRSYASGRVGARDLFVKEISPAWGPGYGNYTTPARATPAVEPDYRIPDTRDPSQCYPGIMAFNGNAGSGWENDNLGVFLRSVAMPNALSNVGGEIDATGRPEVQRNDQRYKEVTIIPYPCQARNESGYWRNHEQSTRTGLATPAVPVSPPDWSSTVVYRPNNLVTYLLPSGLTQVYRALKDNVAMPPDTVVVLPDTPSWQAIAAPTSPGWDQDRVGAHPDSIWDVVGNAMAVTIATARGQYYQFGVGVDNRDGSDAKIAWPGLYFDGNPWAGPRMLSVRDLDAHFVNNLGSDFAQPNSPVPTAALRGWSGYIPDWQNRLVPFPGANAGDPQTPTWNLASLRTATTTIEVIDHGGALIPRLVTLGATPQGDLCLPQAPIGVYTFPIAAWNHPDEPRYDPAKPTYSADERTAVIELIFNDMRLSFFGSSPAYGDDFRAMDFNGDGKAQCSGFSSVGSARERDLHIDQYTTSIDANGIALVPVERYFSNTGTFFLGKSRFWRVLVRGEVWDNVLKTTVSGAQLDSVFCIDPVNETREWVPGATGDPARLYSTHTLYQRWFFDPYRGLLSRHE